jgi:mono/diheme cytochrome c family protein
VNSPLPIIIIVLALALPQTSACGADRGPTTAAAERDLGGEVLAIFSAKCVQCHAATLPRPKGKFGYVLDLPRLAGNPDRVVPEHPEKSKLWQLIADGDMPPDDAKAGALTEEQKDVIRTWIQQGAPAPATSKGAAAAQKPAKQTSAADRPARQMSFLTRSLGWLGRFHVLVIHFPIALLLAAAAAEGWVIWRRDPGLAPAVRFCLRLGAVGAVVAAILGWTRASFSAYHADTTAILRLHRWIGIAAAVAAVGAALVNGFVPARARLFRASLFSSALLVGVAGHFGGLLVYGQEHFQW